MFDNELIQLFSPIIISGLADRGLSSVEVLQTYQPIQQGVTDHAVYISKLFDSRYGFPKVDDVPSGGPGLTTVHTVEQQMETTFQIQVLAIQDPANLTSLTASDIANIVAFILGDDATVVTLEAQGVGILKISQIKNPQFEDDRDRHEAIPSFDFVLTHKQTITRTSPVIESFKPGIYGV